MSAEPQLSDARLRINRLKELPPLSMVSQQLLSLLADDDADMDDVAKAIEMDPALSGRIIGVARSAFFGNPGAIYSVQDAIIRVLGLDMVRSLALTISLGDSFSVEKTSGFDTRRFWTTALLTADLARYLAPHVTVDDPPTADPAYLCGLLHNLGLLAMVHVFPSPMHEVFKVAAGAPEWTLSYVEQQIVNMDHHEAGAWLAHRWHLPKDVMSVMERYHQADYRGPRWPYCQLVGVCSRWSQWRLADNLGISPNVVSSLQDLGVSPRIMDTIHKVFERKFEQTSGMAEALSTMV